MELREEVALHHAEAADVAEALADPAKKKVYLRWTNDLYGRIRNLFAATGIEGFDRLPDSDEARAKSAKLFKELTDTLEAAKIQGFTWDEATYEFGRFDSLKKTADQKRAKNFFEQREGKPVPPFKVSIMLDKLLREFVLIGGFDLD